MNLNVNESYKYMKIINIHTFELVLYILPLKPILFSFIGKSKYVYCLDIYMIQIP